MDTVIIWLSMLTLWLMAHEARYHLGRRGKK